MLFVIPIAVVTHALSMYFLSPDQWGFMIEEGVWVLLLFAILCSILGSIIGSKIAIKYFNQNILNITFLGLLVIIWLRYFVDLLL
ncbi:MAG TPA: hypothetical protein D7H86_05560 [Candidatus Poseidoniales archaeon]|nr:MAG TPA: hypothetical protein D7H86_05560 [Candidatus Poseidoniales archaeon]